MTNSDELEKKTDYLRMKVELNKIIDKDLWQVDHLYYQLLQGYEKLEAENAELKSKNSALMEELKCKDNSNTLALIERMKCCGNCNNWSVKLGYDSKCKLDTPCSFGKHDKWELIKNLDK